MLHRVAIGEIPEASERFWDAFGRMNEEWVLVTHRPTPEQFPLTSPYWGKCQKPAQQADLMRYEVLWNDGGVYVDWDVEPYRSLDPFLGLDGFVGCEDRDRIGNAIMGFKPRHPAIGQILNIALENVINGGHIMNGGPLAVTKVCVGRDDVLVLPMGTFYEMPWLERGEARDGQYDLPWVYAVHRCDASWMDFTPQQKRRRNWK